MHIEDLSPSGFEQAQTAAIYAAVTGSIGSTAREERVDYSSGRRVEVDPTFTTVERVASSTTSPASLWRVTDSTDDSVVGVVFVTAALPGRSTSHSLDDDFVGLATAGAA